MKKKKQSKKKISTSKALLLGVIFLCLEIVFYCEYLMLVLKDTSALYVLIGIPASLIPVILGYFYKSKNENTEGGIVYETVMHELKNQTDNESVG